MRLHWIVTFITVQIGLSQILVITQVIHWAVPTCSIQAYRLLPYSDVASGSTPYHVEPTQLMIHGRYGSQSHHQDVTWRNIWTQYSILQQVDPVKTQYILLVRTYRILWWRNGKFAHKKCYILYWKITKSART